jgi:hypothetical protein
MRWPVQSNHYTVAFVGKPWKTNPSVLSRLRIMRTSKSTCPTASDGAKSIHGQLSAPCTITRTLSFTLENLIYSWCRKFHKWLITFTHRELRCKRGLRPGSGKDQVERHRRRLLGVSLDELALTLAPESVSEGNDQDQERADESTF